MTVRRFTLLTAASALAVFSFGAAATAFDPGGGVGSTSAASTRSHYTLEDEYADGVEALQAGDYHEAENRFRNVIHDAPRHVQTHFLLGLALYGQEEYKSARDSFKKALRYDDGHIEARKTLGVTYVMLGDAEKANDELDELKKQWAACGYCDDSARFEAAVQALEAAIGTVDTSALEPGYRFASWEEGDAAYGDAVRLINSRDFEGAVKVLKVASEALGPHPDVLNYLGYANRKLERFDVARDFYGQALAIDPMHLGAHEYLGELYVETGDLDAARAQLETLERLCTFGCAQAEELRLWIETGGSPSF